MTKSAFQRSVRFWLIGLIAVVLAPLLIFAVLTLAGQCGRGLGQCFGVTLLFLIWVGPIGTVVFSLLLLWSIGRRIKSLDMAMMWTAAVTVWLFALAPQAVLAVGLGGFSILSMFTSPFGLRRVVEMLIFLPRTPFPFLLAFVIFLRRVEPGDIHTTDDRRRAALMVAAASAGYVTTLFLGSALSAIGRIPLFDLRAILQPITSMMWKLHTVATFGVPYWLVPIFYWIALAVFSAALAYLILIQEDGGASRVDTAARPAIGPRPVVATRADFGRRTR